MYLITQGEFLDECFSVQVRLTLHQRDLQLEALQQEQLELLKQLTTTQEALHTREQSLGDLQRRYDELEARLVELQGEAASKDDTIQYLQNEKIVLEVALQVAKTGKEGLNEGVKQLEEDTEAASGVLEQLRQEVAIKSSQVTSPPVTHHPFSVDKQCTNGRSFLYWEYLRAFCDIP